MDTPWHDGLRPVRSIAAPFADEPDPALLPLDETAWLVVDPARGKSGTKVLVILALVDAAERRVFGGTATITAYCFVQSEAVGLRPSRPAPGFRVAHKVGADLDSPLQLDAVPSSRVVLRLTSIVAGGTATKLMLAMANMG